MLTRLYRTACVCAIVTAAFVTAPNPVVLAQNPPPVDPNPSATFRTEINYVQVSARVIDAQGNFVRSLRREDFEVLEDNTPQRVTIFDVVDIPLERAEKPLFAAQPIEPDVATNARPFDGRIFVLALDALQTEPSRGPQVKLAARKFIEENLGVNDLAAVAVIGQGTTSQELTGNRRLLLAAVDTFVGQKPRSAAIQGVEANNRQVAAGVLEPGGDLGGPDSVERLSNARRSFQALAGLSEIMGRIRGRRKAIVYISEGVDYAIGAGSRVTDRSPGSIQTDSADLLLAETNDVIAAATQNDVSIYGVDVRGLTTIGADSVEISSLATREPVDRTLPADDTGASTPSTGFRPDYGLFSVQDERRIAQDGLRTLSDETGGFAIVNANDFTDGFDRIREENSSYYVLGYYSTNDKPDGKFRKIDVRVAGRPGVVVRARAGYVAPREKPSNVRAVADSRNISGELGDLIASPVPISGLTFSATAAPFRAAPERGAVVVTLEVSGKDLKLTETKDGRFGGKLEMMIAAFDRENKVQDSVRSSIDLGFKKETYAVLTEQQGSFRFVSQLQLPPGQYQLQAAMLEPETKKGGSIQYDLEVPDFSRLPVSMSGIALGSAIASYWPTVADKTLSVRLPVAPTALREFAATDGLSVFAHLYGNQASPAHRLDITTTVRSSDGRVVFNSHEELSSEDVQASGGGSEYSARMALKGWDPGLYVLTVELKSRLAGSEPVIRSVQFRVR
jgi:VWFA-related protein